MRIIAGTAKGFSLRTPQEGTRPMTGRAKESLFSILRDRLGGAVVLDLYAGSGALGLEALSRGAASCVFVERSKRAAKVLEANIRHVGLGGSVDRRSVESALPRLEGPFDIVFVDPPYPEGDAKIHEVLAGVAPLLDDGGVIVLHRQARSRVEAPEFLTSVDERRYGDAVVTLMERSTT